MNFNRIKKVSFLTVLLSLVIVMSCDEGLLDQTNPNAITPDTFWRNEEDATKAIIGAYSPFTDIWYYSRIEIFLSDYRDDIVLIGQVDGHGLSHGGIGAIGNSDKQGVTRGCFIIHGRAAFDSDRPGAGVDVEQALPAAAGDGPVLEGGSGDIAVGCGYETH